VASIYPHNNDITARDTFYGMDKSWLQDVVAGRLASHCAYTQGTLHLSSFTTLVPTSPAPAPISISRSSFHLNYSYVTWRSFSQNLSSCAVLHTRSKPSPLVIRPPAHRPTASLLSSQPFARQSATTTSATTLFTTVSQRPISHRPCLAARIKLTVLTQTNSYRSQPIFIATALVHHRDVQKRQHETHCHFRCFSQEIGSC
jgi:hypothetical protein